MSPRIPDAAWSLLGAASRRSPGGRGRGRVARLARAHAPARSLTFTDANGHRRQVTLGDQLESQWFAGVALRMDGPAADVVRRDDWVMDVGANVGIIAGQLAQLVGPQGRVDAVEPVPRNVKRLEQLRRDNDLQQLRVLPVATGAAAGTLTLRMPEEGNSGWASATASWNRNGTLEVPMTTIDELCAEPDSRRLSLIKIDVEGSEFDALAGAARTLRRHRPTLLIEANGPLLRDAGRSSAQLVEACADLGYVLSPDQRRLAGDLDDRVLDLVLTPDGVG